MTYIPTSCGTVCPVAFAPDGHAFFLIKKMVVLTLFLNRR